MMKSFLFLCLCFLLVNVLPVAAQQTDATAVAQLQRAISKNIRVPRSMAETCVEPVYATAKLMYRNGKLLDTMLFVGSVLPDWKASLTSLLPIYNEADWKHIFPASAKQQNFDIYLPFVCYFPKYNGMEELLAWKKMSLLDKDIAASKSTFPYYSMNIVDVKSYGPIP